MIANERMRSMFRKLLPLIILLVVVGAAVAGYLYYTQARPAAAAETTSDVQTTTVRRGSLVISASGSGSVIAPNTVELAFEYSGIVTALNVQVGDVVEAGDVLATLESSETAATLNARISSAELTVLKAQQALEELQTPASALDLAQAEANLLQAKEALTALISPTVIALANAELAVINAQTSVDDAQYALNLLYYGRGNKEQIELARANYLLALEQVERMREIYNNTPGDPETDGKKALALSNLEGAKSERDSKLAILNWYLGEPGAEEVAEAEANLAVAQSNLETALQALDTLRSPSALDVKLAEAKVAELESILAELQAGPAATDVKMAELELANAQAELETVKAAAETQTLVAPIGGTVLSVNAQAGDEVGTNTIITLADLSRPTLEIFVDETDLNNIGAGYEVEVIFDALPDQTFVGHVISVDPSLVNSNFVQAVRGVMQLDEGSYAKPQTLIIGLSASVEVIGSRAENVLLVPVEALREISTDSYGVFMMVDGQPRLQIVEVGLMDYTYAEIKSGLTEGDVVTTGIVETGK